MLISWQGDFEAAAKRLLVDEYDAAQKDGDVGPQHKAISSPIYEGARRFSPTSTGRPDCSSSAAGMK